MLLFNTAFCRSTNQKAMALSHNILNEIRMSNYSKHLWALYRKASSLKLFGSASLYSSLKPLSYLKTFENFIRKDALSMGQKKSG